MSYPVPIFRQKEVINGESLLRGIFYPHYSFPVTNTFTDKKVSCDEGIYGDQLWPLFFKDSKIIEDGRQMAMRIFASPSHIEWRRGDQLYGIMTRQDKVGGYPREGRDWNTSFSTTHFGGQASHTPREGSLRTSCLPYAPRSDLMKQPWDDAKIIYIGPTKPARCQGHK